RVVEAPDLIPGNRVGSGAGDRSPVDLPGVRRLHESRVSELAAEPRAPLAEHFIAVVAYPRGPRKRSHQLSLMCSCTNKCLNTDTDTSRNVNTSPASMSTVHPVSVVSTDCTPFVMVGLLE